MHTPLSQYLRERREFVEAALHRYLVADAAMPPRLAEAMRYSVLAGGKRLRPILVLAGAEAVGGTAERVLPCACAMEMIHVFSLIHDDLPAMDDDDLRRGQPTNHKVFGEAMAILAGDGLLAEAFWCLTDPALVASVEASVLLAVLREIAAATGGRGMVGGQVLDMEAEHRTLSAAEVTALHAGKTGALITAAVTAGAQLAGGSAEAIDAVRCYGNAIGLAFQIADDLLAIEGTEAELGKRIGNDAQREKATYPAMVGVEAARRRMQELTAEAVAAVAVFGERGWVLRDIAEYVTTRRS
ncbi:MAG: polyprenyl synthetase family protein [Deltaproteobacteria bacterium]|nr:polyprenyl synthetase family protein [Deltaproteobacteria bacterium]